MKKLFLSIVFLLMLCAPALGTDVTVSSFQPSFAWRYGSPVTLRVYVSTQFLTSTGEVVQASPVGGSNFYKTITCTVADGVVTVPSFTLPSTDDARPSSARYTLIFYAGATKRDTLFSNYRWPIAYGSTMTIAQLVTWNTTAPAPPRPGFPDTVQVQTLINQVLPVADASDVIKGKAKLSTAPTLATAPIAVGQNVMPFNVKDAVFGAIGDGVADDRAAIQAALDAVPSGGGAVYLPKGTYLVSGSVRPKSNTTVYGDGYGSQIKCPAAGWFLVAAGNMGIINIDDKINVRVTGLRIHGTKTATSPTNDNTPKLIFIQGSGGASVADGIMIDHCWFDNSTWEGIWQGGDIPSTVRIQITNNQFRSIDGPSAITGNFEKAIVSNNIFNDCVYAMGITGRYVVVTGNEIHGATEQGIGVGEIGDGGFVVVSSNQIHMDSSGSYGAVFVNGASTNGQVNITGNSIALDSAGAGIKVNIGGNVDINNNSIQGTTILAGIALIASIDTQLSIRGNTIVLKSESATPNQSNGILATISAGALNLQSSNNKVVGITVANSNHAYVYSKTGTGTIAAQVVNDLATGGYVNINGHAYNDLLTPSVINIPLSDSAPDSAFSSYVRNARVALLNLLPPQEQLVIASGVATLVGSTSTGFPNRQTQVKIDTEAAAASDDLDTINGGTDGDVLVISSLVDARDTTLKDGTGNLEIGTDFTLATTKDRIVLLYDGTLTKWVQLSRSTN